MRRAQREAGPFGKPHEPVRGLPALGPIGQGRGEPESLPAQYTLVGGFYIAPVADSDTTRNRGDVSHELEVFARDMSGAGAVQ